MSLTIQLLGRPCISRGADEVYRFRSRKSWGLLAYLMLSERPPTRSQAAALLFGTLSQGALAVNALVPKELVDVLQAVIIFCVVAAAPEVRRRLRV